MVKIGNAYSFSHETSTEEITLENIIKVDLEETRSEYVDRIGSSGGLL
jgi:hypothetical protein